PVFQFLLIMGILTLVVVPRLKDASLKITLVCITPFGIIRYTIYDQTNFSHQNDWLVQLTVVEMI
ncbi:MAG: DUF2177 family protein, partial [Anaerolineales bacterium]